MEWTIIWNLIYMYMFKRRCSCRISALIMDWIDIMACDKAFLDFISIIVSYFIIWLLGNIKQWLFLRYCTPQIILLTYMFYSNNCRCNLILITIIIPRLPRSKCQNVTSTISWFKEIMLLPNKLMVSLFTIMTQKQKKKPFKAKNSQCVETPSQHTLIFFSSWVLSWGGIQPSEKIDKPNKIPNKQRNELKRFFFHARVL